MKRHHLFILLYTVISGALVTAGALILNRNSQAAAALIAMGTGLFGWIMKRPAHVKAPPPRLFPDFPPDDASKR